MVETSARVPSNAVKPVSEIQGGNLTIKKAAEDLRNMYKTSTTNNFLIYGGTGAGKTTSLRTCRAPVLVHSFDPDGTRSLEGPINSIPYDTCIDNGKIMVDARFEKEDPGNPTVYALWSKEMDRLEKMGMFDHIGTFAIDSLTFFGAAILNEVMKNARGGGKIINRAGDTPQQDDWMPQMVKIENSIRKILSLPCDFVLIAHDAKVKDEVSGKTQCDILVTGKLSRRIPALFSEQYHAETLEKSTGVERLFLTQKTGTYYAKTGMGSNNRLDIREPADIKAMLKKCGRDATDKPSIM